MTRQNPRLSSKAIAPRNRNGFNLIEAAIVLAVVGLVIGGIWWAASAITQKYRINETATGVLQIGEGASRLFPYNNYPTVPSEIVVTDVLYDAKIIPPDWKPFTIPIYGRMARSPMGAVVSSYLACLAEVDCPFFLMRFYGYGIYGSTMTSADCTHLVRRVTGVAKTGRSLKAIFIGRASPADSKYIMLYPPFDTSTGAGGGAGGSDVVCPSSLLWILFMFEDY